MIIIAFRGTEGKVEDIIADAKVKLVKGPTGSVHHGFNDALQEVWVIKQLVMICVRVLKNFKIRTNRSGFVTQPCAALATLATAEY